MFQIDQALRLQMSAGKEGTLFRDGRDRLGNGDPHRGLKLDLLDSPVIWKILEKGRENWEKRKSKRKRTIQSKSSFSVGVWLSHLRLDLFGKKIERRTDSKARRSTLGSPTREKRHKNVFN